VKNFAQNKSIRPFKIQDEKIEKKAIMSAFAFFLED
jgi:hypothetical protein